MKKPKRLTNAQARRVLALRGEIAQRLHSTTVGRLRRAADDIRAGRAVERADRDYIARELDALYVAKRAGVKPAELASALANRARIPRALAAAFVVKDGAEIPALVRAIGRQRSKLGKK